MTAVWQHIVYEEYLPILLGEELFNFYQLGLSDGGKFGNTSHQLDACCMDIQHHNAIAPNRNVHVTQHYVLLQDLADTRDVSGLLTSVLIWESSGVNVVGLSIHLQ